MCSSDKIETLLNNVCRSINSINLKRKLHFMEWSIFLWEIYIDAAGCYSGCYGLICWKVNLILILLRFVKVT